MSHAPIWQLAPRIRGRLEMIVEIVDRAANVYDWELPRRVGGTPEAAELSVPTPSVIIVWDTLQVMGSVLHFQASSPMDRHHHLRCRRRAATTNLIRDSTRMMGVESRK